jgi:hypothetical protein
MYWIIKEMHGSNMLEQLAILPLLQDGNNERHYLKVTGRNTIKKTCINTLKDNILKISKCRWMCCGLIW